MVCPSPRGQSCSKVLMTVFAIMEAKITPDKLQFFPFKGYTLHLLPCFRQITSGILVGIKRDMANDFKIVKKMGNGDDRNEVVHLNVWYNARHFRINSIYSHPNSYPDFSFIDSSTETIFIGDFNSHPSSVGLS
ncbi:hypothetical protein CDAR_255451 [Caerostris darwini]|uniref:Endonuclease/exonuclease/phosphatase domain-containing protein n=1 Tax=Caerostris darwini TaxID=1538125 RepID=A0AAV4NSV6_9ARAC|nr:hypothetical protein CDAR_255451 [Caerostris darwini]